MVTLFYSYTYAEIHHKRDITPTTTSWEGTIRIYCQSKKNKMSRLMTKPTKWLRPAKTQISLGICPVWSVFAVHSMDR